MSCENYCFIVVVYGKTLEKSTTLSTLLNTSVPLEKITLVIWNNGPNSISESLNYVRQFEGKVKRVAVFESVSNFPLSYIYNKVIDDVSSDIYVILDDDTHLNDGYLTSVTQAGTLSVYCPKISSGGENYWPQINGLVNEKFGVVSENYDVISIGSGLIIGREICRLMKRNFGNVFDERFVLYGVDTTFFIRLRVLRKQCELQVVNGLEHSLSRLSEESATVKRFRLIERTYDKVLRSALYDVRTVHYRRMLRFTISHLVRRLLGKDIKIHYPSLFLALTLKKHYRCRDSYSDYNRMY